MSGRVTVLTRSSEGAALCAPGLPICWADDGVKLGLGHEDGALLVGPDGALWFDLPDLVALDATGEGWLALTEDLDDGVASVWELTPAGAVLRATVPEGAAGLRLEGGALVETRGARTEVARLVGEARSLPLPMGAERGRVAVGSQALAWADGPDLYLRDAAGRTRTAGQAPGPVTRLQLGPSAGLLFVVAGQSTLLRSPTGHTRSVPHVSAPPAILGGEHALLQIGEDVLCVPWGAGPERWLRERELCGSARAVINPEEGRVETLTGGVLLDGMLPCAATVTGDAILGPGGRRWPLAGGAPGAFDPDLLAEHLLAHEGHVLAVLEGSARVRVPGGGFSEPRPLPGPFDDPDVLIGLRPAQGGVVLVGEHERVFCSWAGRVRRGLLPKSRRPPRSPPGWHWNDAGLLLRLR